MIKNKTTIVISKEFLAKLNKQKVYERQTTLDLLEMMVEVFEKVRPQLLQEWKRVHGEENLKSMVKAATS